MSEERTSGGKKPATGRARNAIGSVLALIGACLIVFAFLWYLVGVKRLVAFPDGIDHTLQSRGTVTKLTGTHGLLTLAPPLKAPVELVGKLSSLDADYSANVAEVQETVENIKPAPFGLDLAEQNTYVMNRRDCENLKSGNSTTDGEIVDRSGSWYVNFPLGTKKESRNVFNNDVGSAFAVNYKGAGEVNGVGVYIFEGTMGHRPILDYRARAIGLPATTTFGALKAELAQQGVPIDKMVATASGSLTPDERATFEQFPESREVSLSYSEKVEWKAAVEPVTGTVVKLHRLRRRIYVNTDLGTFQPLLGILASHSEDPLVEKYLSQVDQQKLQDPKELYRVEYGWNDATVRQMTDFAGKRISPMRFVKDWMMTTMLLIGAALVVAGLVMRKKEHLREEGEDDHLLPRIIHRDRGGEGTGQDDAGTGDEPPGGRGDGGEAR